MRNFYVILVCGCAVYLIVQLVAYVMYKKVFFEDSGELFTSTKNRIQWQMIFPKNLLLLVVFVFFAAMFGLLLDIGGLVGWLSLPCGVVGGLAVNFLINLLIVPQYLTVREKGRPTDAQLDGVEALVLEDIYPKDYGKVEVINGGRKYIFDAVLANETRILSGERVIIVYAGEGLCFVESVSRFCDVLFENDEPLRYTDEQDFGREVDNGNDTGA